MYKLLSIDLDGTLLNNKKEIDKESIKYLENLSSKGIIIVISTGRSYVGIPKCLKENNFVDYYITSNGATCFDRKNNLLINNWIEYENVSKLVSDPKFCVEFLIDGKWYTDSKSFEMFDLIIEDKETIEYIKKTRSLLNENVDYKFIEKININFLKEDYDYVNEKIKSFLNQNSNIRVWSDKNHKLDLYSITATKGNTLKQLSNILNVSSEEIIAFGDDDNDIEMLEYVGCPIAMLNGNDNVKKISKYTTKLTNDEDGVIDFLKKFVI